LPWGSVAASAADWIYYGRSKGGTISYYDRESVQYFVSDSEEYVTVWTKAIEPEGGSFIVRFQLARNAHMLRMLSAIYYAANGKQDSSSQGAGTWIEIFPESTGEALYNALFKARDRGKKSL
jgi:hypothetical protein